MIRPEWAKVLKIMVKPTFAPSGRR